MSPVERNNLLSDGFWGKPTATIDWCETNYETSYYIAEFWNTVSNVFMIVLPMIGAIVSYVNGMELRFVFCHLSLLVVGIGSFCFHGTLLYSMQLLDELPMIWGSTFLLYALLEVTKPPRVRNLPLELGLFLYCTVVTVVAYALMVICMVLASVRIVRTCEHNFKLFVTSIVSYATGVLVWNMDNIYCKQIRLLRVQAAVVSGAPVLLQGHAWWHALAGVGTYLSILFISDARLKFRRKPSVVSVYGGVLPVCQLKERSL